MRLHKESSCPIILSARLETALPRAPIARIRPIDPRTRLPRRAQQSSAPSAPRGCAATACATGSPAIATTYAACSRRRPAQPDSSCHSPLRSASASAESPPPAARRHGPTSYIRIGTPAGSCFRVRRQAPSQTPPASSHSPSPPSAPAASAYIIPTEFSTPATSSTGCSSRASNGCRPTRTSACSRCTRKRRKQRQRRQHLHPIPRVVVRVRLQLRNKDRHRPIRHRVHVKRQRHPQQQRRAAPASAASQSTAPQAPPPSPQSRLPAAASTCAVRV